jgi:glyoxylase-like metal-dependent hydrolase (beta-lactamase superfamily II)
MGWRTLGDGQQILAGDRALVVVHTPGHAVDHVCLWDEAAGDLYAGDMVVQGTTVVIPGGRGGSLREYLRSLERMAALQPKRILPGHGPIIERPLEIIAEYVAHRAARERQVLECLADGVTEVDAIVRRIYPEIAEPLRAAAGQTIEAHLEMLRDERRMPPAKAVKTTLPARPLSRDGRG